MKTVFFIATVLLSTFGGSRLAAAEQLQDLSPYQTVKLDVNLRTLDSGEVPTEIFYDVPNHYTNSIVCSVDLAIPVSKNGVDGVSIAIVDGAFKITLRKSLRESVCRAHCSSATCRRY